MNKLMIIAAGLALMLLLAGCAQSKEAGQTGKAAQEQEFDAVIYKSSSCGCCGVYAGYLDGKKGIEVHVRNMEDISSIKAENKIPAALQSCHTTLIEGYFVEGHMPAEAVQKLLSERPDVAGIAMPGMPSGSPGMPGVKRGDFVIYAVNHDGSHQEFMRM